MADLEYEFSGTANDGRITARKNWVSGERVTYQYDSLNRLIAAATDSSAWGLSFTFDGFGNRWSQTITKGTAPPMALQFDQSKNRISTAGYSYDGSGNMITAPGTNGYAQTMTYDPDNRLRTLYKPYQGETEEYSYLGGNKRFWKARTVSGVTIEEYYLYGVNGQRIATYGAGVDSGGTLYLDLQRRTIDVYFGGRLIRSQGQGIVADRVGSVVARGAEQHDYFPFGEERVVSAGNRAKFGTYQRDMTGLDYADQRYYSPGVGRFLTADPYEASAGAGEPGSWNRMAYVGGDPVNFNDRSGLERETVVEVFCPYTGDFRSESACSAAMKHGDPSGQFSYCSDGSKVPYPMGKCEPTRKDI